MNPLNSMLDKLGELSHAAGLKIMEIYNRGGAVTTKADSSPLTEADLASHEYLVKSLPSLMAGVPVISEESAESAEKILAGAQKFWLVDPLDGTKEFVKRTNEFTVNIALIESGRPVLGVVHAPALGVTYYGDVNTGAWRQDKQGAPRSISTRKADARNLSVVASKDHAGPLVTAMLERMPGAALKSMGSSLKFCLVAEGAADVYLRDLPTMEWDTAAAQAVVEAAGGGVFQISGTPLNYGKPEMRNSSIMTVGDRTFAWRDYLRN